MGAELVKQARRILYVPKRRWQCEAGAWRWAKIKVRPRRSHKVEKQRPHRQDHSLRRNRSRAKELKSPSYRPRQQIHRRICLEVYIVWQDEARTQDFPKRRNLGLRVHFLQNIGLQHLRVIPKEFYPEAAIRSRLARIESFPDKCCQESPRNAPHADLRPTWYGENGDIDHTSLPPCQITHG